MATNPNYSFHIYSGETALTGPGSYPVGSIIFEEFLGSLCIVRNSSPTGLVRFANGIKGLTINNLEGVPTSVVFTLLGDTTETLDLSKFQTAAQVSLAITEALKDYVKTSDFNTYQTNITTALSGIGTRLDGHDTAIEEIQNDLENVYTKGEVYTKTETDSQIESKIGSLGKVFRIKGSKDTYAELPATGNENGDVWQVKTAGTDSNGDEFAANTEFYWDGSKWEILGINEVDMSNYLDTDDLTNINDELAQKLDRQSGAATTGNIVIWGNSGGEVADSGKSFATTLDNSEAKIPTNKIVSDALGGKMDTVAGVGEADIPIFDKNGQLANSGMSFSNSELEEDESKIPSGKAVADYVMSKLTWSTWPTN